MAELTPRRRPKFDGKGLRRSGGVETVSHMKAPGKAESESWFQVYWQRHLQVFMSCLGQFYRSPISNLLTILVIAISLSLPALMLVGLENVRQLTAGWDNNAQVSLFLKSSVSDREAQSLSRKLAAWNEVGDSRYISPEQSLAEFKAYSGFSDVLDMMDKNPLPGVITVQPKEATPAAVDALLARLQKLPEVDLAQLDMAWLKKLHAMMEIAERGALVLGILLAMAVLLIVGNTVRVGIQQRRAEIEVSKLVGATNRFIRRPFLYLGALHGLVGGLLALILVTICVVLLQTPVAHLAELYQSSFDLVGLGFQLAVSLLGISIALGWFGALFTVSYYIKEIEPA